MKLPEKIGIAGTHASGKDALAQLRHDRQGARIVSLSDILRAEATKRGLDHQRATLISISTQWGKELGAGALALMTMRNYEETRTDADTGLSIVSVRRAAEAEAIQSEGGKIIWVDGERRARYGRVTGGERGRAEDLVSYEEFCAQEDLELYGDPNDPTAINMSGVREIADIHIDNNFESAEAFEAHLIGRFEL